MTHDRTDFQTARHGIAAAIHEVEIKVTQALANDPTNERLNGELSGLQLARTLAVSAELGVWGEVHEPVAEMTVSYVGGLADGLRTKLIADEHEHEEWLQILSKVEDLSALLGTSSGPRTLAWVSQVVLKDGRVRNLRQPWYIPGQNDTRTEPASKMTTLRFGEVRPVRKDGGALCAEIEISVSQEDEAKYWTGTCTRMPMMRLVTDFPGLDWKQSDSVPEEPAEATSARMRTLSGQVIKLTSVEPQAAAELAHTMVMGNLPVHEY